MSITVGLRPEALDVLFFRDRRPFAAAGRDTTGLPMPQTVAGALRTALLEAHGRDFRRMRKVPSFQEAVRKIPPSFASWRHRSGWLIARGLKQAVALAGGLLPGRAPGGPLSAGTGAPVPRRRAEVK